MNYIKTEIEAHLDRRSWDDVILCGRSQGAFVAMYLALSGYVKPGKVISLCGFYPDEIIERGIKNMDTPILWLEAQNDTVLTGDKKSGYQKLQALGCNLKYILDEKSDHDHLFPDVIESLP